MASKGFEEITKDGSVMRWRGGLAWLAPWLALCWLLPGLPANAQQGTFITFNAPGAGTGASQGTCPFAINPAGEITGYCVDANETFHGFLWIPPSQ
jgi:hypothetical protein